MYLTALQMHKWQKAMNVMGGLSWWSSMLPRSIFHSPEGMLTLPRSLDTFWTELDNMCGTVERIANEQSQHWQVDRDEGAVASSRSHTYYLRFETRFTKH